MLFTTCVSSDESLICLEDEEGMQRQQEDIGESLFSNFQIAHMRIDFSLKVCFVRIRECRMRTSLTNALTLFSTASFQFFKLFSKINFNFECAATKILEPGGSIYNRLEDRQTTLLNSWLPLFLGNLQKHILILAIYRKRQQFY